MSSSGAIITLDKLSKRFNREWIFRDLSFQFKAGSTYAITGGNGSGKSTLLHVLSGIMPPSSGTITYQSPSGEHIAHEDFYKTLAIAAPYMELIDEFTLQEQIKFHFKMKKSRQHIDSAKLIQIMRLESARDKQISNFSSGMKQRVKLALAFYTEASVILLDEPGTNLDHTTFDWYKTELQKIPENCVVVVASNNPEEYSENAIILGVEQYKRPLA
jgi:ABC-type multidrug transport system ATPase subunit